MKLVTTLPDRPGFLHALPVFDLFGLLLLLFVLGPSLLTRSGVVVELPPSRFQMERFRETLVVTLGAGESGTSIHFGSEPVTRGELVTRLDSLREDGVPAKAIVLLQTDAATPVGIERSIKELILAKGFRLALVGRPEPPPDESANEPDER